MIEISTDGEKAVVRFMAGLLEGKAHPTFLVER